MRKNKASKDTKKRPQQKWLSQLSCKHIFSETNCKYLFCVKAMVTNKQDNKLAFLPCSVTVLSSRICSSEQPWAGYFSSGYPFHKMKLIFIIAHFKSKDTKLYTVLRTPSFKKQC